MTKPEEVPIERRSGQLASSTRLAAPLALPGSAWAVVIQLGFLLLCGCGSAPRMNVFLDGNQAELPSELPSEVPIAWAWTSHGETESLHVALFADRSIVWRDSERTAGGGMHLKGELTPSDIRLVRYVLWRCGSEVLEHQAVRSLACPPSTVTLGWRREDGEVVQSSSSHEYYPDLGPSASRDHEAVSDFEMRWHTFQEALAWAARRATHSGSEPVNVRVFREGVRVDRELVPSPWGIDLPPMPPENREQDLEPLSPYLDAEWLQQSMPTKEEADLE